MKTAPVVHRYPVVINKVIAPPKPHTQCPVCGVMDFSSSCVRDGWCRLCNRFTTCTPFTPDLDMTSDRDIDEFLARLKENDGTASS